MRVLGIALVMLGWSMFGGTPDIQRYPASAEKNRGFTVIIGPGCSDDGRKMAARVNTMGINAVVLRDRPMSSDELDQLLFFVRCTCVDHGGLPDRIGVMGFSAEFVGRLSCRPDFVVRGESQDQIVEDLRYWLKTLDPAERLKNFSAQVETVRWQAAIDRMAAAGGGCVTVPAGRHLTGTLYLRDNVELHLESGAVLEGTADVADYPRIAFPDSEGDWMAVVMGLGVKNAAITGPGVIHGNGGAWPQPDRWIGNQEGLRPRGLFFNACRDLRLEDFTLKDAACWGVVLRECVGVSARRVKIDSHANVNNDGFDIEARNVLIEDCVVDADDDAYCLKSHDSAFVVENITIRNCIGRSNCNVFKLGTASYGMMRNVSVENLRIEPSRRSFLSQGRSEVMPPLGTEWYWSRRIRPFVGCNERLAAISGVAVECVDGGTVSNITVRNVTMTGVMTPIFVRGGTRHRPFQGKSRLENVVIENVRAEADSFIASSVTGVTGCRPENIVLRDVRLRCRGAGENVVERTRPVPEKAESYPEANMFDCLLPAYGLYIRHADVRLENVELSLLSGTTDRRDSIVREEDAQ